MAPTVSLEDTITKRLPGESVSFQAKLSGTPTPSVTWTVNGRIVKPSVNIKITEDDQFATLTIKKICDDDENIYTVRVENEHGIVDASQSLLVISKYKMI